MLGELQHEHRLIREQLARVGRPEAADRLIAALAAQARETAERLRDRGADVLRVGDAAGGAVARRNRDGIDALERAGIVVREIVVNRVLPDGAARVRSAIGGARTSARRSPQSAGDSRAAVRLRLVAATVKEPRGIEPSLRSGASGLRAQGSGLTTHRRRSARRRPP